MQRPPSILIVANDPADREFYRSCLAVEGYRIIEAVDGPAGLSAAGANRLDVILLNVSVPGFDGIAWIRQIKSMPKRRDVPLVIVGSEHDAPEVVASLNNGADEHVIRPVHPKDLCLRVGSMVRLGRERRNLLRSYRLRAEQIRILSVLLDLCRQFGSASSVEEVLDHTLAAVAEVTGGRRISIILPDPDQEHLEIVRSRGLTRMQPAVLEPAPAVKLPIDSGIVGTVYTTGRAVVANSREECGFAMSPGESEIFAGMPFLSAPLNASGEIIGVLNISERVGNRSFVTRDLEYIELIAGVAGSAVRSMREQRARDEARDLIVVALAKLAEHRDCDTGQHVERVTTYTQMLAEALRRRDDFRERIDDQFLQDLARAVPLHDIGKVAIPDRILHKPGRLTAEEMAVMRTHAQVGADTLHWITDKAPGVEFLRMAEDIVRAHHEWYDGSGYPSGLAGEAIPLCARIVALVDVYDALTTDRVYRDANSHDDAEAYIRLSAGTHFDPAIVEVFLAHREEFRGLAAQLGDQIARPQAGQFRSDSSLSEESSIANSAQAATLPAG